MNEEKSGRGVFIDVPLPEEKVFRSKAVSEILELLSKNPFQEFSKSELTRLTGFDGGSLKIGIETLEALDLIEKKEEGRRKLVSINQERLEMPENPLMSIPQKEFRKPVRKLKQKLMEEMNYIAGIMLFGSVARGEADRKSDIDVLVVVEDRLMEARRMMTDVVAELEEEKINGERYGFEVLVEDVESIKNRSQKLVEIFSQGIILYKTKKLEDLKEEVLHG